MDQSVAEIAEIRWKIIVNMLIVAAVLVVGGAVFHRSMPEALYFAIGVILSTGLNVLKLHMIGLASERIVQMEIEGRGKSFAGLQYLLRFLLTAAVLVAAAYVPFIDLIGAIFGVFTMQIAFYIWNITNK